MAYYQYLKRDFEASDQQHCYLMVHVGLQREGMPKDDEDWECAKCKNRQ